MVFCICLPLTLKCLCHNLQWKRSRKRGTAWETNTSSYSIPFTKGNKTVAMIIMQYIENNTENHGTKNN